METGAAENNLFPHTFQSHNIKFYKEKKRKKKKRGKPQQSCIFKIWEFLFTIQNIDLNDCLKFLRDHSPFNCGLGSSKCLVSQGKKYTDLLFIKTHINTSGGEIKFLDR